MILIAWRHLRITFRFLQSQKTYGLIAHARPLLERYLKERNVSLSTVLFDILDGLRSSTSDDYSMTTSGRSSAEDNSFSDDYSSTPPTLEDVALNFPEGLKGVKLKHCVEDRSRKGKSNFKKTQNSIEMSKLLTRWIYYVTQHPYLAVFWHFDDLPSQIKLQENTRIQQVVKTIMLTLWENGVEFLCGTKKKSDEEDDLDETINVNIKVSKFYDLTSFTYVTAFNKQNWKAITSAVRGGIRSHRGVRVAAQKKRQSYISPSKRNDSTLQAPNTPKSKSPKILKKDQTPVIRKSPKNLSSELPKSNVEKVFSGGKIISF